MSAVAVSGHCKHCSFSGRLVVHGVPWCPHFFATAGIDTNMGHRGEGGRYIRSALAEQVSRPVEIGELVWLVDVGDGEDVPFATWGRVISDNGWTVKFVEVGHTPGNGWCYAEESA